MKFNTSPACLIFFILVFSACDSDDEPHPGNHCIPRKVIPGVGPTDSIVYKYDSSLRLDKILHYDGGQEVQSDQLEFDDQGRFVRFSQRYSNSIVAFTTFELTYNKEGRPGSTKQWFYEDDDTPLVMNYTYDSYGRLSTRQLEGTGCLWRYEYYNYNVIKVYYKKEISGDEFLGRENHTFDVHTRYFVNVPELVLINFYMLVSEPNENNVLTSTVYWDTPGNPNNPPKELTYTLSHNPHGLITGSTLPAGTAVGQEFYFNDVEYECH